MNTFVEEYRKELSATGYPFLKLAPIMMSSGFSLPIGSFCDASLYADSISAIPRFQSLTKNNNKLVFKVGEYSGECFLNEFDETVELYSDSGLFGGILVLNEEKIKVVSSWTDTEHTVSPLVHFCPRCLVNSYVEGVNRIRVEDRFVYGKVRLKADEGAIFEHFADVNGIQFVRLHYVGEPAYSALKNGYNPPVLKLNFVDSYENTFVITPNSDGYYLAAVNGDLANVNDDILSISGNEDTITIELPK
jgi:hypothetical protein